MPTALRTKQEAEQQARDLLVKAKMHVAIYHCFFGALLERLKLKCDWRHPTMYTDAVVIGYSPEFVLTLTFEHAVYIMIHEVMHCALGHPFRRNERDAKRWNAACDYVINSTLNRDPELVKMFPKDGLFDARFEGMAAEQVYAILEQEAQQQQQQQQQQPDDGGKDDGKGLSGASGEAGDCLDAGASGEPLPDDSRGDSDDSEDEDGEASDGEDGETSSEGSDDDSDEGDRSAAQNDSDDDSDEGNAEAAPGLDPAQLAQLEKEWGEACITAQLSAGGEVDSAMARAIGEGNAKVKSFEEHVDDFAVRTCSKEDSWSRPNRRYADTYLPSRCAPGVQVMVIGIDTSGSISAAALGTMQTAAQHILDDFGLKEMHVVYCDSRIHGTQVFVAGDQVVFEQANGGGGTRFHPVLRYALELQQQGEEVAGVIYLTDLQGGVSDAEDFRDLEVLWVNVEPRSWRNNEAPEGIGHVVNIN